MHDNANDSYYMYPSEAIRIKNAANEGQYIF